MPKLNNRDPQPPPPGSDSPTRPPPAPLPRCDKEEKERGQTITYQRFHCSTKYLFQLMYAYIVQGRPDAGLLRLGQQAQTIITPGIGVYPNALLQPTQITTRTAQENPVDMHHPTAIARLPVPSNTNIIILTDTSGTHQRTQRPAVPPYASPVVRMDSR